MPEFMDIVGQEAALAQLQRALAGDRRPHAYLFTGPVGVGRRTTAEAMARLLLCDNPRTAANDSRLPDLPAEATLRTACGQCPSCRTAQAGTNPDVHVIRKELAKYHDDLDVRERKMQDLGIGVIRQFIIDAASMAAAGGRGKAFIVCEAELMSIAAQNALLKTLEEPPRGVTIVLVATSAEDLLPTTRSRCQTVRFAPLPIEFVTEAVVRAGAPAAEAAFWARMTGGSVGRALRLHAEGLYPFKAQLVDQLAALAPAGVGALATTLTQQMDALSKTFVKRDDDLSATVAGRQAGQIFLELLTTIYRDALTLAVGADRPLVHADQRDAIVRLAGRFGPEAFGHVLTALARYEQLLWRNVSAKLLWDNVAGICAAPAAED